MNKNYYKDILDHDYCQNVPRLEGKKPQLGPPCDPGDILDLEDGEVMDEFDRVEKEENRKLSLRKENTPESNKEETVSCKSGVPTKRGMKFGARNYRKRDECSM